MLSIDALFYDIAAKLPLGNAKSTRSLSEVLQRFDFVTLHVPATPQTHGMIGAEQLAKIKKGSFLLNISRGTVVDLEAFAASMKKGHVAGAAIDAYPEEPESNSDGFKSVLQGLSNMVLTPHIGGSTMEAQEAIGREVAGSLIKFIN